MLLLTGRYRDLQRRQPDAIVAQLLGSLQVPGATPTSSLPPTQPIQQSAGPEMSRTYANARRAVIWDQALGPHLNFGLEGLTGSLQVQNGRKVSAWQKSDESSDLRVRIHLPRWFSSKYIDSIVRRSQAGWTYYFHSATLHSSDSATWKAVAEVMRSETGSLLKLKSMIAEGQISLYDTREWGVLGEQTLMEVSKVCFDHIKLKAYIRFRSHLTHKIGKFVTFWPVTMSQLPLFPCITFPGPNGRISCNTSKTLRVVTRTMNCSSGRCSRSTTAQ